ncbi:ethanolaminephosphotransferase 1-like [Oscarella lobularis]|uniref:ethanolaminephosphotransferase 1-like n=1 Tax=Oscarella lobularis TaxID=121494 RepID=UPI003313340D
MLFSYRYLKEEHFRGFDKYKYSAIDTSPLSTYVMHPFWNAAVNIFPTWVAPNLLTFVGWFYLIIIYALLTYYDPDFHTTSNDLGIVRPPIPSWVYVACALLHFLSHTFDGIDGKQARRTRSSSALGELFDHGLDSLTVWLITTQMYSIAGTGTAWSVTPFWMLLVLQWAMIGFYVCHWEKYITGVLYLPWSYDLVQLGTLGMYIGAAIYGNETLHFYVISSLGITFSKAFAITVFVSTFAFSIPCSLWNIYLSYKEKTLKQTSLTEQLAPGSVLTLSLLFPLIWTLTSPADIINTETRWIYWLQGILYSNGICRLIVSQMSSTQCNRWNWMIAPFIIVLPAVYQGMLNEVLALKVYAICVTLLHLHYGVCVVRQLCDHLKINCFSIPPVTIRK